MSEPSNDSKDRPVTDSGSGPKSVWVSREIAATPEQLFEVIADPTMHHVIDGSGTVRHATGEPRQLQLGDKFSTNMRIVVPYRMRNTVVEYEKNRLIAWSHMGRWRWRYELESIGTDDEPRTRVTETFDWGPSPVGFYVTMTGAPERNRKGMEKTLARLDAFVTNTSRAL